VRDLIITTDTDTLVTSHEDVPEARMAARQIFEDGYFRVGLSYFPLHRIMLVQVSDDDE
jgi:hypothetical protein